MSHTRQCGAGEAMVSKKQAAYGRMGGKGSFKGLAEGTWPIPSKDQFHYHSLARTNVDT